MLSITAKTEGVEKVIRALEAISPSKNPGWIHEALKKAALKVQSLAKDKYIIKGSRFYIPGTKTLGNAGVNATRVTSRIGTLRSSIKVDLSRSPKSVDIGVGGAARKYGPVHEIGGNVHFGSARVREHKRTTAFGRKVKEFTVPSYVRSAYTAYYRPRPYLAPALDEAAKSFQALFTAEWRKQLPK